MAHEAFISYAFEDELVANALCGKLEEAGIRCWFAARDPRPGLPYGAQIVQAIAQSRIVLFVFSRHANASRAVLGEVELGANRGKSILPLRIERVEPAEALEYYIRAVQWFDATRPPLDTRLSEVVGLARELLDAVPAHMPHGVVSRNNLPSQLTSFVGREKEVAELSSMLEANRLVTLAGSPGVGKTRISLQIAANLLDGFGDGVWFIELAPLARGDYIPSTVAQALGLTLASEGNAVVHLVQALKTKHALLVFDNCEHLVDAAGHAIAAILRDCPWVKVLASSRQALGISGENTYRLPPLALPNDAGSDPLGKQDAAGYPAVALFVERALAVDRSFTLTDESAPIVAEICRRLDGIPLAIELAAARVKILSPRQLRDYLGERFRVLTGGSRDSLPRQQTLLALIDWSYGLLDERERTLFRRLGIFVNGFTLEGAVAVGSDDGLDKLDLVEVLASLVDKSIVLAEAAGDTLRYYLLESTRVYAREKLEATPEREVCAKHHVRYLRDRFIAARDRFERTALFAEIDDVLASELEDVRAALDETLSRPDAMVGGELLAACGGRWMHLGLERECIARIEAFLGVLSDAESLLLARLWTVVAAIAIDTSRSTRALEAATQALDHARASGDPETLREALRVHAQSTIRLRRFDDAEVSLDEAAAIPGASAAFRLRLLNTRAYLSVIFGDLATAARAHEQLRNEHRALGNVAMAWVAALNLAEVEHIRGRTERSIAIVREVLPELRAHTDRTNLVVTLVNFSGYLAAVGDLAAASAAAREAMGELAVREPESAYIAMAIEHSALALALGGDLRRAATLTGYADDALRRQGSEREFTEKTTHLRLDALLRERLTPEEFARLSAEGAALTPGDAVALALQ